MSRSRFWLVSLLTAVVVFASPLAMAGAITKDAPEIRITRTGDTLSALIVTPGERLLVINSDDRGETRSAVGRFARPWEPETTVVLAPADDDAALGLWEALRDPRITRALVVGLPGSNPIWSQIEKDCAQRGVELKYVSALSEVKLTDALLTIEPGGATVSMSNGSGTVAISLGDGEPSLPSHVAVVSSTPVSTGSADLVIAASVHDRNPELPLIAARIRETLHLRFDGQKIRVQGGFSVVEKRSESN